MIRMLHTGELDAPTLRLVRGLLDEAFEGGFTDDDWQHGLGGTHALVIDDGHLVAHGSLVLRRLLHAGRSWRVGYVEAVAVRAVRRRSGHATEVMTALESLRSGFDFLALSSSEDAVALYEARGWRLWTGPTSVLGPRGIEPTPDEDGSVYVLPGSEQLDLTADLTCDWRAGDVW